MNKRQIQARLAKLGKLSSENCRLMIEAGLGTERYSESLLSTHPLSIERVKIAQEEQELRAKLPVMFPPRKIIC